MNFSVDCKAAFKALASACVNVVDSPWLDGVAARAKATTHNNKKTAKNTGKKQESVPQSQVLCFQGEGHRAGWMEEGKGAYLTCSALRKRGGLRGGGISRARVVWCVAVKTGACALSFDRPRE